MAKAQRAAVVDEATPSTLRVLLDRLHPAVLDVVCAPGGLDIAIGDPVILDPAESAAVPPQAIVLCVGVEGERARIALIRQLADQGATAAVIKHVGPVQDAVLTTATEAGVALLVAPPPLSWGQLYTLLLTAGRAAPNVPAQVSEAPLGDLFALANAIAAAVGGATTIEDATSRVLAYSNLDHPIDPARQETILGRQVPSTWIQRLHEAGVFRRLWQTDEVVRIADFVSLDGYLPRVAVAVRAGGELLGSIWVIEGRQPLGGDAERTLRDAADIAALHLLRHRVATDVDRRRRAEAVLALLDGSDRGDIAREALGFDSRATVVVAFDVAGGPSLTGAGAVVAAQRVADLAAVYCESYRRQAACAVDGARVYALVPVDDDDIAPAQTLAEAIVDRAAKALRLSVRAGLGSAGGAPDGVARSRREADEVLEVLGGAPDGAVGTIAGLRARVILHRLTEIAARDPDLSAGRVGALAEQDAVKGTSWIQTLRAYFDAFGDMASAAAMVNVHPNTFRYRLRRITEVFGLDLDDPDERLVAELQLRFLGARRG